MAQRRPLGGYPASVGAQAHSVFPHIGPASYTPVTIVAGTVPILGGDIVNASEAGLKNFDHLCDGVTDDGAFRVVAIPISASNPTITSGSNPLAGIPKPTYRLMWFANKTATLGGQAQTINTEAVSTTNLSAFCVRLKALGV